MIHVDRDRLDDGGRPIRPSEDWFSRAKSLTETALREGARHEVADLYRQDSVRLALEGLFHRKCAYCETPLAEVGWEVEHFRPKGAVSDRPDHPGYYWLAYDWTNLYPCCAPCNRRLEDKTTWEDPDPGQKAGKATQFPLADEAARAMSPADDLTRERPLLLDPCADRPEEHLRYTPIGDIEAAALDPRGTATIDVFHLKRRRLRDRRKEYLDTVVLVLKMQRSIVDPNRAVEFARDLERLFFSDSAPFAGAARQVRRDPEAFGV